MWPWQIGFRSSVEQAMANALEGIGARIEPRVFLIGLLAPGGARHPIAIEPEDGPLTPSHFANVGERARELAEANPEARIRNSDPTLDRKRRSWLMERSTGRAIGEAIESALLPDEVRVLVAAPVQVEEHFIYTATVIPAAMIDSTPSLTRSTTLDGRIHLTTSLMRGVIEGVLQAATRALQDEDPGWTFGLGTNPAELARRAGDGLVQSIVALAGNEFGPPFFDSLNRVSTMRYEKRVGLGRILVTTSTNESIERDLVLAQAIPILEVRTIRKLLEVASGKSVALLANGSSVHGFGRLAESYDPNSETVFEVVVIGHGNWDLRHAGMTLMHVDNGTPHLPERPLAKEKFEDIARRVFASSGCDTEALWRLATTAAEAEHGTMLVASASASEEASRLGSQAMVIEPAELSDELVRQVTSIDGAVLVDPQGRCHAIGVILDGVATSEGDRSRGARFNSAVRYLSTAKTPTVIILVSEDGMVNLLPDLRPRIRRTEREALMTDLQGAAALEPVNPEAFYRAFRRLRAAAFYLTQGQCDEANRLMEEHWERRRAAGSQILSVSEALLKADPLMSDEYLEPDES